MEDGGGKWCEDKKIIKIIKKNKTERDKQPVGGCRNETSCK